jgi:hypothetical protein
MRVEVSAAPSVRYGHVRSTNRGERQSLTVTAVTVTAVIVTADGHRHREPRAAVSRSLGR